jgi:hypothetical protein
LDLFILKGLRTCFSDLRILKELHEIERTTLSVKLIERRAPLVLERMAPRPVLPRMKLLRPGMRKPRGLRCAEA